MNCVRQSEAARQETGAAAPHSGGSCVVAAGVCSYSRHSGFFAILLGLWSWPGFGVHRQLSGKLCSPVSYCHVALVPWKKVRRAYQGVWGLSLLCNPGLDLMILLPQPPEH